MQVASDRLSNGRCRLPEPPILRDILVSSDRPLAHAAQCYHCLVSKAASFCLNSFLTAAIKMRVSGAHHEQPCAEVFGSLGAGASWA